MVALIRPPTLNLALASMMPSAYENAALPIDDHGGEQLAKPLVYLVGADALATLADRLVRQADDVERRHAVGDLPVAERSLDRAGGCGLRADDEIGALRRLLQREIERLDQPPGGEVVRGDRRLTQRDALAPDCRLDRQRRLHEAHGLACLHV